MKRGGTAVLLALFVVAVGLAGCADRERSEPPRVGRVPYGWDEEAPARSELSREPFYVLTQSSSFLVKGASYARYVLRVDQRLLGVELFFTSTNANAPNATHPNVGDDEYHFEFMQIRPLGSSVRVMDVSAGTAFSNASTGPTFTLTYIYGRGANYQYLAPYEGNPGDWTLEPGYYELVVATDEELTVGVNVKLGTPLWSTFYHPQELGEARAEALESYLAVFPGSAPRELRRDLAALVEADAGEFLNYFAFSNLIYRSNLAALATEGTVQVRVDESRVPHRLQETGVNPVEPHRTEAYAYAVSFNEAGPARHDLRTLLEFTETASVNSDLAAQMLLFAVVVTPKETLSGVPRA